LIHRQRTAANAQRLGEICAELTGLLSDSEDSISSRWGDVNRLARELQRLDPAATGIAESATAIFESLQDLGRDIERHSAGLECDPETLLQIEERLDTILGLKRKYGANIEAILEFGREAASRLAMLRARELRGSNLDADIASARTALEEAGKSLSKARRKASPKLEELVRRHLADLGFARAGFSISFEDLVDPAPDGFERVEFLFAPNPGEPERALRAIASSGEISRVMLALKTSLADQDRVPVLIFDEIDANVGGEIGAKVGAKMRELSASHQIFCITHLPQVAAAAGAQFVVVKETRGERTRTLLKEMEADQRIIEIARMLGGPKNTALGHARTLIASK
jgi:DNA repair protein RecN (Recombination protein N)